MLFDPPEQFAQLNRLAVVRRDAARVATEHLVGVGVVAVLATAGSGAFELWREEQINAIGHWSANALGRDHGGAIVLEDQVFADLRQTAIDTDAVFCHAGAVRPSAS